MNCECKNQKGFTLIELLTGLAVMTIMLSVALPLLSNMTTMTARGQQNNNGMQEARWALQLMANDIRAGNVITTPTTDNTNSATLAFERWNFPKTANTTINYSLINGEICRQEGTETRRPLTDSGRAFIQNVTFRRADNGKNITITITLSNKIQAQQTVYLLNANN